MRGILFSYSTNFHFVTKEFFKWLSRKGCNVDDIEITQLETNCAVFLLKYDYLLLKCFADKNTQHKRTVKNCFVPQFYCSFSSDLFKQIRLWCLCWESSRSYILGWFQVIVSRGESKAIRRNMGCLVTALCIYRRTVWAFNYIELFKHENFCSSSLHQQHEFIN